MRISILVLALLCADLPQLAAQSYEGKTLRGVRTVVVTIESINADAVEAGLDSSALRTAVEVRLRAAGVRVQPVLDSSADGFVYVSVTTLRSTSIAGLWAFAYSIEFQQTAVLPRRDNLASLVTSWGSGGVSIVGANKLDDAVEKNVLRILDQFLNDWLSVNPR